MSAKIAKITCHGVITAAQTDFLYCQQQSDNSWNSCKNIQLNGSVKEPNTSHNYRTEKIIHKASDVAEYIELFGSSTRDRHARRN